MIIKYKGRPLDEGLLKLEGRNLQAFPTIKHVKGFSQKHLPLMEAPSICGRSLHVMKGSST